MGSDLDFDMIPVKSSNLEAIGYYNGTIRIAFKRGSVYDYTSCTKEEFVQGVNSDSVSGWFIRLKAAKHYKQVK